MAFLTRNSRSLIAVACVIAACGIGCAGTTARGPRVVWVRGDRVYVASPDSGALDAGMILTFKDRGKQVAAGEVTAVHDGEMIAAKLTSGSLATVKHPEKLEVMVERSDLRPPRLLRVGYPAVGRRNLLFDCRYQSLDSSVLYAADRNPDPQKFYRSEELDGHAYRLVRVATPAAGSWPETLLVRLFDEASDEEIALERGDLDAAVFWPGEASTHIREITGWRRWEGGVGARGRLTAAVRSRYQGGIAEPFHDAEQRALELLNEELFRSDLLPVPRPGMSPSSTLGRFKVDVSLPGHETMEQFLNRATGSGTPVDTARVVQVSYHEIWPTVPVIGDLPEDYWLVVRCPVISQPRLQPYLHAINTEALANLFQCLPAPRKP